MEVTAAKNPQNELTFEKFARVKFTELKSKYPQKTDKDIFSLVNKQWQTKSKTQGQSSVSSVKMEKNLIQDENEVIVPKKLEYPEDKMKEESKKVQIKEESEKFSESNSIKATPRKSESLKKKVIQKQAKAPSQYNSFYKSYYRRLHNEHPRWTRAQINQIVNLLWRRFLLQQRSKKIDHTTKRQIFKKKGGRAYFGYIKRAQGLNNQQISKLWKSFPAETKKYFGLLGQGKGLNQSPAKSAGTTIVTFQSKMSRIPQNKSSNLLGFLNKKM